MKDRSEILHPVFMKVLSARQKIIIRKMVNKNKNKKGSRTTPKMNT